MDIQMLKMFFMWCTILNMGLLIMTSLWLAFAGNFVYKMHSRLYPMPRETFNVVVYSFVGIYKIIFFVFNFIPWIALMIIG